MKLHEKILQLRKESNLSQEGLAEKTGVSRQSVAKWENAEALPEIDKLVLLSKLFAVTIDSLVKDDERCPPAGQVRNLRQEQLVAFLCRAKKETYAGHGREVAATRPNSHDLSYSEGDLTYYDTYLGGERFAGEEALWQAGIPFWSMNYLGRVVAEGFSGDFLKEALSAVTAESPFRGPSIFIKGEFSYHCSVSGTFEWFDGNEEILLGQKKVYECLFHGGTIK